MLLYVTCYSASQTLIHKRITWALTKIPSLLPLGEDRTWDCPSDQLPGGTGAAGSWSRGGFLHMLNSGNTVVFRSSSEFSKAVVFVDYGFVILLVTVFHCNLSSTRA